MYLYEFLSWNSKYLQIMQLFFIMQDEYFILTKLQISFLWWRIIIDLPYLFIVHWRAAFDFNYQKNTLALFNVFNL